jgi:manganese/zinc/iron transport system ATP- binding protein
MNESRPSALLVEQLSVNYDKTPVLWDISLKIPQGQVVGIVGPNGAGKSTFIKTVLGLVEPLAGHIEFFGEPLAKVRGQLAYVPQRESVDWDFPITVRDLVLMGRYGRLGLFRWPRQADKAAAEHYLDKVGMRSYAERQISQLSGGQQQRVFIARALLQEAEILFLDEPFSGIDMATEKVIMDLLQELKKEGKTLFVVHHDLNRIERYFDWLILLNMRLVAAGPTLEVFNGETLQATFGKSYALFDEAFKLSHDRTKGVG